jgi:hypothetical protein
VSNTNPSAGKRKGGLPPLAWIIIALVVLFGVIAFFTANGSSRGGTGNGPNMPIDTPQAPAIPDPAPLPSPAVPAPRT